MRDGVKPVIAYFKIGDFFGCGVSEAESPARQRFDTDNQLLHAERLFQIIVGAKLKPLYDIIDGRAGGKEQYRRMLVSLADAAYHFKTVHAGHHYIGHEYIGAQVEEPAQSLFTVGSGVDGEVLPFERVFYNHGKGFFILNQ